MKKETKIYARQAGIHVTPFLSQIALCVVEDMLSVTKTKWVSQAGGQTDSGYVARCHCAVDLRPPGTLCLGITRVSLGTGHSFKQWWDSGRAAHRRPEYASDIIRVAGEVLQCVTVLRSVPEGDAMSRCPIRQVEPEMRTLYTSSTRGHSKQRDRLADIL